MKGGWTINIEFNINTYDGEGTDSENLLRDGRTHRQTHRSTYRGGAHLKINCSPIM